MEYDGLLHLITLGGSLASGNLLHWSNDNVIALSTMEGVHLFALAISDGLSPISIRRDAILPPSEIHERDFGMDKAKLIATLPRGDAYLMILDRTMSSTTPSNPPYRGFRESVWSPKGLGPCQTCCLAVLTVDYWLALYTRSKNTWDLVVVLSDLYYERLVNDEFDHRLPVNSDPAYTTDLNTFKRRSYAAAAVKVVWSHIFKVEDSLNQTDTSFGYLFVAHKDGCVVIWEVKASPKSSKDVKVVNNFFAEVGTISAIHWIQVNDHLGYLIVGGINGECKGFRVRFEAGSGLTISSKIVLWPEQDKLSVSVICSYKVPDDVIYIISSKGCYLIAWMLKDGDINKFAQKSGGYLQFLTGISASADGIVACTADGTLLKICIDAINKEIKCENIFVSLEDKDQSYGGICLSPNKVVSCVIKCISSSYNHLAIREPLTMVFSAYTTIEDVLHKICLFMETKEPLTSIRDLLFYLHYYYKKHQVLPSHLSSLMQMEKEQFCHQTISKLQLLRWLFRLTPLTQQNDKEPKSNFASSMVALENVLLQRALFNFLKRVQHCSSDDVSKFMKRTRLISRWLKKSLTVLTNDEIKTIEIVDQTIQNGENEIGDTCPVCHIDIPLENVRYGKCAKGHISGRCCFSLIVCDLKGHKKCAKCLVLADDEAVDFIKDSRCPFCSEIMR